MNESEHRKVDLKYKRISAVISVFGFLAVCVSIYAGLSSQTTAINNQWGLKFYEDMISRYLQATRVAAEIAVSKSRGTNEIELQTKIGEFKSLYWGSMAIVEGKDVEEAMILFNKALDRDVSADTLKNMSLYLAHVCKNESRQVFLNESMPVSRYGSNEELLEKMRALLEEQTNKSIQPNTKSSG